MRNHLLAKLSMLWIAALAVSETASAQARFSVHASEHVTNPILDSYLKAAGDLDGDGDLDFVHISGSVHLMFTLGAARVAGRPAPNLPSGTAARAFDLGDVDGDGDPDLVVALLEPGSSTPPKARTNLLWLNDGKGNFTDASSRLRAPADLAAHVLLVDVDKDQDLDLFLCDELANTGRLLLNDGKGTFTPRTGGVPTLPSDSVGDAIAADVDGDGDADILLGLGVYRPAQDRLLRNDGKGNFTDTTKSLPISSDPTTHVLALDVDGDGDLDLFKSSWGQDHLWLNDGKGTFKDATSQVPVSTALARWSNTADLDGDRDLDLVVEIVTSPGRSLAKVLVNDGKGVFHDGSATRLPAGSNLDSTLQVLDLDGDRDPDLLARDVILLNDGNGRMQSTDPPTQSVEVRLEALTTGDVDGDGDADILTSLRSGPSYLVKSDGRGNLTSATRLVPFQTEDVALADVDADGDLDAVYAATTSPRTRLLLNDGKGGFTAAPASWMPPYGAVRCVLTDLDGDRDADLVLPTGSSGTLLLTNDGTGRFAYSQSPAGTDRSYDADSSDLDGDGDTDLVLFSHLTGTKTLLNDGKGTFKVAQTLAAGIAGDLGDVDGDGDLDIAMQGCGSPSKLSLWLNNGKGVFTDASSRLPNLSAGCAYRLAILDLDFDGDHDIVSSGGFVLINDGTGKFSQAPNHEPAGRGFGMADVDGDRDLDIIGGSTATGSKIRIARNLRWDAQVPLAPAVGGSLDIRIHARGSNQTRNTALPVLSTKTASIPLGGWGVLAIDLTAFIMLPPIDIPSATGVVAVSIPIPNTATLAGLWMHGQVLIDSAPSGGHLTNPFSRQMLR